MNWYTLRVISGKEKKIKEAILYDVSTSNMDDKISDVLVPSENIVEMRDGKKKIKERVFFPGYLLIRLEMNKETKYLLENVNGVISFVGPKGDPKPLKPDEAQRFLGDFDGGDGPLRVTEAAPYKVGDPVKVTDGPFMDFSGYVQEVNHDKQKLKVLVSIGFNSGYVVSKDEEYSMELNENKTLLVYKRNLDGFEIKFDSGYELFNENPDYEFNLKLTSEF